MSRPVIALDADGVLLDYNLAYSRLWQRAFGVLPRERDAQAYWAKDRWEVELLEGERLDHFVKHFDEAFWSTLPALQGAVDACHRLHGAGFELVCVSALPLHYAEARLANLRREGFPIERIMATGNERHAGNPKAAAIAELRPSAFVDDFLPNLAGLPGEVHTALILREPNGSPNDTADLARVGSTHQTLADFADWRLADGQR